MSQLSPKEKIALLYVKKKVVVPVREFRYGSFRCDSLIEKKYLIKIAIQPKQYEDGYTECYAVKISPEGIDALDMSRISKNESRIALILSIAAIIFTFITAFTPFADWIKSWIASLFQ
jgi:hypothetical protein